MARLAKCVCRCPEPSRRVRRWFWLGRWRRLCGHTWAWPWSNGENFYKLTWGHEPGLDRCWEWGSRGSGWEWTWDPDKGYWVLCFSYARENHTKGFSFLIQQNFECLLCARHGCRQADRKHSKLEFILHCQHFQRDLGVRTLSCPHKHKESEQFATALSLINSRCSYSRDKPLCWAMDSYFLLPNEYLHRDVWKSSSCSPVLARWGCRNTALQTEWL